MVFSKVQEIKNISMPRFDVNSKGTFSFAPALVHVTRRIIKDAQHGNNTVGGTIGPFDVRSCSPNVVDRQSNSSCRLGNLST